MVGTSKILTVSYGTFSCTLEGFDDSFSTMKAIAEYFRGLASDDRYFGAEPPTPDAEMLAQIAEREISRRVDAHMDDGGIHLRAAALTDQSDQVETGDVVESGDDAPLHDEVSRGEVEAARKAAKAERKAAKKAARKAAKADAKAAEEAAEAEARAKAEADAQAEAEANAQAAEIAAKEEAEAAAKTAEDDLVDDDTTLLGSVSAATADTSDGLHGSEVEETRDFALSSTLAASDPAPEISPDEAEAVVETIVPAHPDSESVAAKLQRIRAVVSNKATTPSDDLTEQFLPQAAPQDVADETSDTKGSDLISRVMTPKADDIDAQDDATVEDADQPRARVLHMKRADFEKAVAESETQAEPEVDDLEPTSTGPDLGMLDGADDLEDYLEDSDFVDDGMGFDDEDDHEIDADLAEDLKAIREDHDAEDEASSSPVEQFDAQSDDVSELDDSEDDAETDVAEEAAEDDASEDDTDGKTFLTEEPEVDGEALDRLMSESDAQMQEPEGSRRRDAIDQLKAAVAAKEAARLAGESDDDDQDLENAFRNDLSEVVVQPEGDAQPDAVMQPEAVVQSDTAAPRPRPVVRSASRTERPRPAPLKLVAAQRIDLPETEQRESSPVVPRRVAARNDDAQQQSANSFAAFAENMGASELPDLLEAAAAYTSFVEGADEFSRPQILRRVRSVASDDFNREDGLRSFADLLKAGRITKVRNGRFQVADDSRFKPEQRAG